MICIFLGNQFTIILIFVSFHPGLKMELIRHIHSVFLVNGDLSNVYYFFSCYCYNLKFPPVSLVSCYLCIIMFYP